MTNRQGRRRRHKRHKERTKLRWGNHVLEVWVREMRELFKSHPAKWVEVETQTEKEAT